MPNWCYNTTIVQGPLSERTRFLDAIKVDDGYRIVNVVPMPEALNGTESPVPSSPEPHPNWAVMLSKGEMTQEWYDELVENNRKRYEAGQRAFAECGYTDWYTWANSVWGTKWGDCETSVEIEDNQLDFRYDTAWGPLGQEFWERASMLFPRLSFVSYGTEESNAFLYCWAFINGVCIYETEEELPYSQFEKIEDDEERWEKINDWENEWCDGRSDEALDAVLEYGALANRG
jgi:hypothetical protein